MIAGACAEGGADHAGLRGCIEVTDTPVATGGRRLLLGVWGAAGLLAGLGTATAFEAAAGVNWGIWTTVAGAGLLWLAARRANVGLGARLEAVTVWSVVLAIVVAWGAAVTANDLFQFFIGVACVTLLAVATRVIAGVPGEQVGAGTVVSAPLRALGTTTAEAGRLSVRAVTGVRGQRYAPMVRGVAIAVPVAGLFALVLAGADPVLSTWGSRLLDAMRTLDFIPRLVFFFGLGTIVLGAYGLTLRAPGLDAVGTVRGPAGGRIGETERRMIVGSVALVFGLFLAVQLSYFFRDTSWLRINGMTYAQYAHRGFSELTIAATLAVALIVELDRRGEPQASGHGASGEGRGTLAYWGTLLLVAEVLVVLASALHRLALYEAAYGYTMLRLYVQAYVVGVAITLLLLAGEVVGIWGRFDARRVARRSGIVAVGLLVAFSFGNPEGWVVSRNMDRYRRAGDVDADYLASLSLNAAPAVVAVLPELPSECSARVRSLMGSNYARDLARAGHWHWYEWNVRRTRGIAALDAARVLSSGAVDQHRVAGCMGTGVEQ